ncbi:MAG: hypothetical protein ACK6D4_14595, partial [Planctomyces sp.]
MEFAEQHFRTALAQAMEDGQLAADEVARLHQIARSVGESADSFAKRFFRKEGESFLRGIFQASIEDGGLTSEEWLALVNTSQQLGITAAELQHAVARPAAEFVEHVLADAKSENSITADQEAKIEWLLTTLSIAPALASYARDELRILH